MSNIVRVSGTFLFAILISNLVIAGPKWRAPKKRNTPAIKKPLTSTNDTLLVRSPGGGVFEWAHGLKKLGASKVTHQRNYNPYPVAPQNSRGVGLTVSGKIPSGRDSEKTGQLTLSQMFIQKKEDLFKANIFTKKISYEDDRTVLALSREKDGSLRFDHGYKTSQSSSSYPPMVVKPSGIDLDKYELVHIRVQGPWEQSAIKVEALYQNKNDPTDSLGRGFAILQDPGRQRYHAPSSRHLSPEQLQDLIQSTKSEIVPADKTDPDNYFGNEN